MNKEYELSFKILRIGLGLTILWFGVVQILNPSYWIGYLPSFLASQSLSLKTNLVYFNGIFEIVLSLLLIFNNYVRNISILMSIHLFFIILSLGLNEIGVRDFGILVGFLALIPISNNSSKFQRKISKKYKSRNLRKNQIKF